MKCLCHNSRLQDTLFSKDLAFKLLVQIGALGWGVFFALIIILPTILDGICFNKDDTFLIISQNAYNFTFSSWLKVVMNLSWGMLQCLQEFSGYSHDNCSQASFWNFYFIGSISSSITELYVFFSLLLILTRVPLSLFHKQNMNFEMEK